MTNKDARAEQAVRAALCAVRPNAKMPGPDTELMREYGLDSLQVMDMVMEIEDRLDISVPVETLVDARTYSQLCAGVARLLGEDE